MRRRYSATDLLFIVFLLLVIPVGVYAHYADDQAFWTQVMEYLAYFVAASIFVNLARLWRACQVLRR